MAAFAQEVGGCSVQISMLYIFIYAYSKGIKAESDVHVHVTYHAKCMVRQPGHVLARPSLSMAVDQIAVACKTFC